MFYGSEVIHNTDAFKESRDVACANHWSEGLADVVNKVFTCDFCKCD